MSRDSVPPSQPPQQEPAGSPQRKRERPWFAVAGREAVKRATQFLSAAGGYLTAAWPAMRWFLWRALALVGSFVLFLTVMVGLAGWYTSRSEFCRSCHIMEPYYVSWQKSKHNNVPCIECHFPPGVGEEVRGKMLGLVQLAKYVTRSEGPRPAAEIPDASCLRSGCHQTRLLSGKVDFHGVPFDHTPHLGEVRRGMKLRCTSCHSQIVQGQHITVTTSTCFLCHFKGTFFNEGLGACTRCHQIPDEKFDLGGGVMFSHDLAYERGVDCINCHGDLIRGKGDVPRERCLVCHNRQSDLAKINDHLFMHAKHVAEHKVDCLECHLEIQHSLDRNKIVHAAADCKSCHPDHHHEQVDLLLGRGAKILPAQSSNMMIVMRAECRTCHRVKQVSATGTVLWKASADVCLTCHDAAAAGRLESYEAGLNATLAELESGIQRVRKAMASASLDEKRSAAVNAELAALQHDVEFMKVGNGIHNVHFAATLSGAVRERLAALCRELKIPEPPMRPLDGLDGWK